MDKNSIYYKQVSLLIQTLPYVAKENCFALKGGTAINLFIRNFPRLSVDIDLTFLPIKPRDEPLTDITVSLSRISDKITKLFPQTQIQKIKLKRTD